MNMYDLKPNDPCHCGSGKKYKKCHMRRDYMQQLQGGGAQTATKPKLKGQPTVVAGKLSPMRTVPSHLPPTPYAKTGKPSSKRGLSIVGDPDQQKRLRAACQAARRVLEKTAAAAKPGVTTDELDAIAHQAYIDEGGYPSTLNYHGYKKSICTSINEVICHGIPDDRPLRDGDIVNIDVTIYKDGFHGDCSKMVMIGDVTDEAKLLVKSTEEAMLAGIGACKIGAELNVIGRAIESVVRPRGFSVVRAFVGHGIGETFHADPQVVHYYDPRQTLKLVENMVFTVEPMINAGTWEHQMWDDDWTAVTADLRLSAQYEHTLILTKDGPELLTLPEGQEQPFLK